MSTPSSTEMSSIDDPLASFKLVIIDAMERFKGEIEMQRNVIKEQKKEIDKQKSEIEEQQKEIDKQRNYVEEQMKVLEELEVQLEFVKLDKMRTEQDLKEECNKNEECQKLLEQMKSRVLVAEEELVNFKSLKGSLENSEKEVKTEADLINHKALPRHKGNGKPLSEKIVEILDSDEDYAQNEIDVKKIPEKLSMDKLHLYQTVSEKEGGVLKRKRALVVDEGNRNEDSHDRIRWVQISRENGQLRTQVENLELTVQRQCEESRRQREEFDEFRRRMEQFMASMNANPSASFLSR